jgi:hypothetical protein
LEINVLRNTKTTKAAAAKGLMIDFLGLSSDWGYNSPAKEVLQARDGLR